MKESEIMKEAMERAKKMQNILLNRIRTQPATIFFKIGLMAIASLIASFVDAVTSGKDNQQKKALLNDLVSLSIQMLDARQVQRDSNPKGTH